jgi:uncharacterized protein YbjT (DUF2867 family)
VRFDWDDATSVEAAVKGVDAIFLLTPFTDVAVGYAKTLVAAAKAAGVKKIVKLSAVGAETEGIQLAKWHREAERAVEGSGLAWVVLRPSFFMTNFVAFYPPDKEGVIPAGGNGKAAWIDPRDIADTRGGGAHPRGLGPAGADAHRQRGPLGRRRRGSAFEACWPRHQARRRPGRSPR